MNFSSMQVEQGSTPARRLVYGTRYRALVTATDRYGQAQGADQNKPLNPGGRCGI
jgi:hypothetical protein